MKRSRFLLLLLCLGLGTGIVSAQTQKRKSENTSDYFRKWLDEDVVYLITHDERAVFDRLTTVEEREQFIEQFWSRRDPTPGTAANEFKEEHYIRIKYANENFAAGLPGWRSDRGMIYIKYGRPDSVKSNPTGGAYTRESYEGGGTTSTYPFEVWSYRNIPGVGQDVEIEFVDRLGSGDYRIARDAFEKDALFHMGGGATDFEKLGLVSRRELMVQRSLGNPSSPYVRSSRLQDQPLERLGRLSALMKPPPIRFTDLRGLVETEITYQDLSLQVAAHVRPLTQEVGLASVTAAVEVTTANYVHAADTLWQADTNLYGRVTALSGRVVYEFDEDLTSRLSIEPTKAPQTPRLYQKKIPLPPGRYKLVLVAREAQSKKIGSRESLIVVPPHSSELTGFLVVAKDAGRPRPGQSAMDPFVVTDDLKVYPSVDRLFSSSGNLGVFAEFQNLALDAASSQSKTRVRYRVVRDGVTVPGLEQELTPATVENDLVLDMFLVIPLASLRPGDYRFEAELVDLISGKNLVLKEPFQVR